MFYYRLLQICFLRIGLTRLICCCSYQFVIHDSGFTCYRIFCTGGPCASCNEQIPPNEMVYKAAVSSVPNSPANNAFIRAFHMRCFTCCKCGLKLSAGDRYCFIGGNLYCEQDWNKFLKGSAMPAGQQQTTGTTIRKGKVGRPRRSRD